jgi:hypothetical protein
VNTLVVPRSVAEQCVPENCGHTAQALSILNCVLQFCFDGSHPGDSFRLSVKGSHRNSKMLHFADVEMLLGSAGSPAAKLPSSGS